MVLIICIYEGTVMYLNDNILKYEGIDATIKVYNEVRFNSILHLFDIDVIAFIC